MTAGKGRKMGLGGIDMTQRSRVEEPEEDVFGNADGGRKPPLLPLPSLR